jgi:spore maturation protein CgeB
MKVILSCAPNPRFEALPEYLAAALERLGHDVRLFDHRAFLFPGRLRSALPMLDRLDRRRLNNALLRLIRSVRPETLIVNQGMVLTQHTIEEARALGTRCVNWFSDYPAEFEAGLSRAPAYEAFFLASSFAVLRHREAGHRHAHWLPFACDPERHHPDPTVPIGASMDVPHVLFVGSHYPERQILLRHLRGLPVGVWGPGWERALGDPHVAPMIRGGSLRPAVWRSLYARCRVALNIHYGSFGPQEVSGDLASTRVFEILACGAYQVVDRQGDVLRLFQEGVHLAAFTTGEEMRARVEEALRHDDLRRRVAARGRALVLEHHTYEQRARHLLDPHAASFEPGLPAGASTRRVSAIPGAAAGGGR